MIESLLGSVLLLQTRSSAYIAPSGSPGAAGFLVEARARRVQTVSVTDNCQQTMLVVELTRQSTPHRLDERYPGSSHAAPHTDSTDRVDAICRVE